MTHQARAPVPAVIQVISLYESSNLRSIATISSRFSDFLQSPLADTTDLLVSLARSGSGRVGWRRD